MNSPIMASNGGFFYMGILLMLALLNAAFGLSLNNVSLELQIEPRYQAWWDGDIIDSSLSAWDIHRGKITLSHERDCAGVHSEVSVDVLEKKIVQDAFIRISFNKYLKLRAGRFKLPFGLDYRRASHKLNIIERSRAAQAVQSFNGDDSRAVGAEISGRLPFSFCYALGVFDGPNYRLPGFEPLKLAAGKLRFTPFPIFEATASFASQIIYRQLRDSCLWHRAVLFDASLAVRPLPALKLELEYFCGDNRLNLYIPEIMAQPDVVHASLRVFAGYALPVRAWTITPCIDLERANTFFASEDKLTAGLLCLRNTGFKLFFNQSFIYNEDTRTVSDYVLAIQVSYYIKFTGKKTGDSNAEQ